MLYILHGEDRKAATNRIAELALLHKTGDTTWFTLDNQPQGLPGLFSSDLFGGKKLLVFDALLKTLLTEDNLEEFNLSENIFIFLEESLDNRTKLVGSIKKQKNIFLESFGAPDMSGLKTWLTKEAGQIGLHASSESLLKLLEKMGLEGERFAFNEKKPDLGKLRMELQKLKAYIRNEKLEGVHVEQLVSLNQEAVGFAVIDALASGSKSQLYKVVEKYFSNTDQASLVQKTLLLNALLSEQFRSLWVYKKGLEIGMSEKDLQDVYGFKSGRMFSLRKLSERFTLEKIEELLSKLEHLDLEQKTTTLPTRVVLELVLGQV